MTDRVSRRSDRPCASPEPTSAPEVAHPPLVRTDNIPTAVTIAGRAIDVAEVFVHSTALSTAGFVLLAVEGPLFLYETMHAMDESYTRGTTEGLLMSAFNGAPGPEAAGRRLGTRAALEGWTAADVRRTRDELAARRSTGDAAATGFERGYADALDARDDVRRRDGFREASRVVREVRAGIAAAMEGGWDPARVREHRSPEMNRAFEWARSLPASTPGLASARRAALESRSQGVIDASEGRVDEARTRRDASYAHGVAHYGDASPAERARAVERARRGLAVPRPGATGCPAIA